MRGPTSILSLAAIVLAMLRTVPVAADQSAGQRPSHFPPSRALAGVRAYDDATIEALAQLAAYPDLLAGLRADTRRLTDPQATAQVADPVQRELLEKLSRAPEVVRIALEHPEAHAALSRALLETPEGAAVRLAELREAFDRAALHAARDWQRALENDPVALGEYRELVTRFCHEQRMAWPDFPCVQVLDRSYYYACPPDEAILAYGMQHGLPPALQRVLTRFWKEHSPQAVDARILGRTSAPRIEPVGECLAAAAVEARRAMFSALATPDAAAAGLVPVMLQPPADRPAEAREAFALSEHDRLWGSESGPAVEAGGTFVVREPGDAPPPVAGAADAAGPSAPAVATEPSRREYVVHEQSGHTGLAPGWDWGWWPGYATGAGGLIWTDSRWCRPYLLPFTRYYSYGYRTCRTRYFRNYGYPYGDWACREGHRDGRREPLSFSRGVRLAPGGWPVRNGQTSTGIGRIRGYPSAVFQVRRPPSPDAGGGGTGVAREPAVRAASPERRPGTTMTRPRAGTNTRGAISPARPARPTIRSAPSPARPQRPEIRRSQWPGSSSRNQARAAPPTQIRPSVDAARRSR